jgi:hypothetical protein
MDLYGEGHEGGAMVLRRDGSLQRQQEEIVMPNPDKNKPTRKDRLRTIIAGLQKHYPNVSLVLVGQTIPTAQLVLRIQQDIDAADVATQAHTTWIEKVQIERNLHLALAPLLRALRSTVLGQFGDTKDAASTLGDFGYTPRKVAQRPSATKAEAAVKSRATRTARHTMGTQQKKKVKGTVAAEPSAPTATSPGTPQGSPGTVKPNA